MLLYKYRVDSEYCERTITASKVWLATAEGMNDPFECSIDSIDEEVLKEAMLTQRQAQMSGFVFGVYQTINSKENFMGVAPHEMKKILKKISKKPGLSQKYKIANDFLKSRGQSGFTDLTKDIKAVDKRLKRVGIFSLSETCVDPKMWAQYADNHKGLCLGFQVSADNKLGNEDRCLKVSYEAEIPRFNPKEMGTRLSISLGPTGLETKNELTFEDPNIRKAISTKSIHWTSEKEWRYVEEASGEFDLPAPLVSITFGFQMSPDRKKFYLDLAQEHIQNPVKFYSLVRKEGTNDFATTDWVAD